MKKTVLNEEFKRMQKLAGIINENVTPPENIKKYLLDMTVAFGEGNDNEYPEGKEMEFKYEGIDKEDIDMYDEEDIDNFIEARDFLEKNGPIEINDIIDWNYSTNGKDIIMNWIEPNWDEINKTR
jgi:hypothetical protein